MDIKYFHLIPGYFMLIERAKILAHAVSGEARPYGDLPYFLPEKGSILANATPIGMHPNKDRIPVSEVPYLK